MLSRLIVWRGSICKRSEPLLSSNVLTVADVVELALNVSARRHDCHVLGRQHLKSGRLVWSPHKTQRSTGKQLSIKASREFLAALKAMQKNDCLTFLTTDYGRPFKSAAALGNKMADWCRAAGLEPVQCNDGKVRSYRLH